MCINVYVYKIEVPDETVVTVYAQIPNYHTPTLKSLQKLLQKHSLCHWNPYIHCLKT